MRLLPLVAVLIAIASTFAACSPTSVRSAWKQSVDSEQQRQVPRPESGSEETMPRRINEAPLSSSALTRTSNDFKGKRKLTDVDVQLDEYLAKKQPRRGTNAGIRKQELSRENVIDAVPRSSRSRRASSKTTQPSRRATGQSSGQRAARTQRQKKGYGPLSDQVDWKERIRKLGAEGIEQQERRETFEQLWEEQGLSTNMDPKELADKIFAMRGEDDTYSRSCTALGARKVRGKNDPDYEAAYLARMTQLGPIFSAEMKRILKDSYLRKKIEREQRQIALQETFKGAAKMDKRRAIRESKSLAERWRWRKDVAARIDRVGRFVEGYLKEKNLDLKEMPLNALVKEVHALGAQEPIAGLSATQFRNSIYRYIMLHRGVSHEAMDKAKRAIWLS